MKTFFTLASIVASVSAFAAPSVSDVEVSQIWAQKPLRVSYSLSGGDAIVTAEIFTNGFPVAAGHQLSMSGDVNRVVQDDGAVKAFVWNPPPAWWGNGRDIIAGTIDVHLSAWPIDNPPDYMVLDLDGSKNREYFTSEDRLPLGIDSDVYRTDKLVMRRIHAKGRSFRMGASHFKERGQSSDNFIEMARHAMLTADFYIGVFEFTQAQYHKINGNKPSRFANPDCWEMRPVEYVQRFHLMDHNWPNPDPAIANSAEANNSKMFKKFRNATGLDWRLTLPTRAQWEYACRAGTMTPLYDGCSSTYVTNALGVSEASCRFSRNADNGGAIDEATSQSVLYDTTRGTARVGSYEPNAWGLYDMLGNVSELCHDFYNALSRYETMTVDPDGFTNSRDGNSTFRVTCGGSCRQLSIECRPSRVYSQQDWLYSTEEYVGFRPVYILP